jgi:hypothetical protein
MSTAERRQGIREHAWDDAILYTLYEWTVPDHVDGLSPERLLEEIIHEATAALDRLKERGLIDHGTTL